ncbi:hypothetical protein PAPYR_956 [Paratrimastix pyriformis]|uniref:Uncharacterized protein n=1 Tax=Paratrimastix pyriformis TaxID=342808 RepID=A0ABQ8UT82_9EUKA|nr:hypothetical protein PAPYR_956 [Paratrimastix pyriformis]
MTWSQLFLGISGPETCQRQFIEKLLPTLSIPAIASYQALLTTFPKKTISFKTRYTILLRYARWQRRKHIQSELHFWVPILIHPVAILLLHLGLYLLVWKADSGWTNIPWLIAGIPLLLGAALFFPWCMHDLNSRGPFAACWVSLIVSTGLELVRLDRVFRIPLFFVWLPALVVTVVGALWAKARESRCSVAQQLDRFVASLGAFGWLAAVPFFLRLDAGWPWLNRIPWAVVLVPVAVPGLMASWETLRSPITARQKALVVLLNGLPEFVEYLLLTLRLGCGRPTSFRALFFVPFYMTWPALFGIYRSAVKAIDAHDPCATNPGISAVAAHRWRQRCEYWLRKAFALHLGLAVCLAWICTKWYVVLLVLPGLVTSFLDVF